MSNLCINIEQWILSKNLNNAKSDMQILKLYEELGELSQAVNINDYHEIKDAIGDIFVATCTLMSQLKININYNFKQSMSNQSKQNDVINISLAINQIATSYQCDQSVCHKNILGLFHNLEKFCSHTDYTLKDAVQYAYNQIKNRSQAYANNQWA